MVGLIQKSGFIKPGKAAGYIEYIATRDGVEKVGSEGYLEYMATRPGSHGLFGSQPVVSLNAVIKEVEQHTGTVWTLIYSLRREDAARLGYDNAESWRKLVKAHQVEMATAMKIPPEQFRWYAAYHDADTHPHIHMTVWSDDPKLGFLTPEGIKAMRSVLTNSIFQDELYSLYQQKDISYKELTTQACASMRELLHQMENTICDSPTIEMRMLQLARELKNVSGKKVYGYLPQRVKKQVDEIVDQMTRLPSVQMCYNKWLELQQEVNEFYSGKPMERTPLSQQKEFRAIHNAVVQAAVQLGQLTFEDKGIENSDEPDDTLQTSDVYWQFWTVICDSTFSLELRDQAVERLQNQAEDGDPHAQFLLGRLYRDGPLLTPDWVEARYWFEQAAQSLPDAQYALGKLLLTDDVEVHDREQGIHWLTKAAEHGNEYAAYRLGKELLQCGDPAEALSWFTASAEAGNPYAEYLLGKLYWEGEVVPQDKEQAVYWLTQAAEQGHAHAQILLERQDSSSLPSAILAVNSLFHQMGRIFQDNAWPKDGTHGQHTDHKLRRRIQEKKIAMGHKPDDHEEQGYIGPAM